MTQELQQKMQELALQHAAPQIVLNEFNPAQSYLAGAAAMHAELVKFCRHYKNGECHSFIVGYETPDNRLHEKCADTINSERCEIKF